MNPRQVSRIALRPETLDGIVFWTKNPAPLLPRLKELGEIPYYVQFTLNAYGADLEPGVPSKQETVVPTFQALSRRIGAERVIWRYDPILLTPHYTAAYHVQYFEALARRLAGYTDTCVISFADDYRHLRRTAQELQFRFPDAAVMRELAGQFSDIAGKCGLTLVTCAEAQDLSEFGHRPRSMH